MTIPVGSALGFVLGGAIGGSLGWRYVYYLTSIPGFLLGIAYMLYVKDPPRGMSDGKQVGKLTCFLSSQVRNEVVGFAALKSIRFSAPHDTADDVIKALRIKSYIVIPRFPSLMT